jgi:hypothetical protein
MFIITVVEILLCPHFVPKIERASTGPTEADSISVQLERFTTAVCYLQTIAFKLLLWVILTLVLPTQVSALKYRSSQNAININSLLKYAASSSETSVSICQTT